MHIGQHVMTDVPSAIAHVQTTNESKMVVDDDEFLMVSPIEGHVAKILEDVVIGVSHDVNLTVAWGAFRTQGA